MRGSVFGLAIAAGVLMSLVAVSPARAESCMNDIDCKANGIGCGTDVCAYDLDGGQMTCVPASTGDKGWCSSDTDCKCNAEGATCVGVYCSATTPGDGGAAAGDAGSGPTAEDAGADAGSTGTTPPSDAGASSGSSTTPSTPSSSSSSGCSMGRGEASPWAWSALVVCGVVAGARRKNRKK